MFNSLLGCMKIKPVWRKRPADEQDLPALCLPVTANGTITTTELDVLSRRKSRVIECMRAEGWEHIGEERGRLVFRPAGVPATPGMVRRWNHAGTRIEWVYP